MSKIDDAKGLCELADEILNKNAPPPASEHEAVAPNGLAVYKLVRAVLAGRTKPASVSPGGE